MGLLKLAGMRIMQIVKRFVSFCACLLLLVEAGQTGQDFLALSNWALLHC